MQDATILITRFTEFLEAFAKASDEARASFLDFIKPQDRRDLLALADALHKKAELEGDG